MRCTPTRYTPMRYTPIRYTPSEVLRWGQLVTSPLWAQELSFMHLLEIVRTQTDNKEAFYETCLWVLLPHRCHAPPIVQPAFWPAVIPPQYTPSEVYTHKAHTYEVHIQWGARSRGTCLIKYTPNEIYA
jgi:hypothetical protein